MKKNAFTLIEMLVAVAIIIILAMFLYPALMKAREKGRCAQCASNLHQLWIGTQNYISESGGRLPWAATMERLDADGVWRVYTGWIHWKQPVSLYNKQPGWIADKQTFWWGSDATTCVTNGALYPYVRDIRVYLCPTFARKEVCGRTDAVWSYQMNAQLDFYNVFSLTDASRRLLFADGGQYRFVPKGGTQASGISLLDDSGNVWQQYDWNELSPNWGDSNTRRYKRTCDPALEGSTYSGSQTIEHLGEYHSGLGNAVFADGHVQRLSYTNTLTACAGQM